MKRPVLNKIDDFSWGNIKGIVMTMGKNQWDIMLEETYNIGGTLVELDDNEQFVAAYRMPRA